MTVTATDGVVRCERCQTEVAAGLRACPGCHRLVFSRELQELADEANAAVQRQDRSAELRAWRMSLDFLPPDSRQFAIISEKVEALSRSTDIQPSATSEPAAPGGAWKTIAVLGPIGLLLWKFKFVVVLILTKGKLLLLGLTKGSTFLSMLLSMGVYW